jgi:hypothetical protein
MKRSEHRILTTHMGSLVPPKALLLSPQEQRRKQTADIDADHMLKR